MTALSSSVPLLHVLQPGSIVPNVDKNGKIECLFIGHNDSNFEEYVHMVRSISLESGAYRDLRLAFIEHEGKPYRALDIFSLFHGTGKQFHNTDFLWPAIVALGNFVARRGFNFDYVSSFQHEKEQLRRKLTEREVGLVAITTTLYVSPHPILEIVAFIRQHNPGAKIVIGGPYIANQAAVVNDVELFRIFEYLGADYYVISNEGESALGNLLQALRDDEPLEGVHNISFRRDGKFIRTQASREENRLEDNLLDLRMFRPEDVGEFLSIRTAKSCPFSCSFCGFPRRAGEYVYEAVEPVERMLDSIKAAGTCTTLTFLDDTFNVPKKRFREILQMMIRKQYGFRWNSFYRSDHGDAETIEMMKAAGCEGVFLGVESGSDFIMERMNKTSRRKHYLAAIPAFREAGILTYASLIVGFPGESYETVAETRDLIETARPDFFRAQLWYCDPMTPIWSKREQYGVVGSAFHWRHDTMDAETACDLIDQLFLSVQGSTWLPQWGFEQWSTFYLQRLGMSRDQVKTFIRCFNATVREQLLFNHRRPEHAVRMEKLEASCKLDSTETAPAGLAEEYVKAERFWINEAKSYHLKALDISEIDLPRRFEKLAVHTNHNILQAIASQYPDTEFWQVLLTAFGGSCAAILGVNELVCLTARGKSSEPDSIAPVNLTAGDRMNFPEQLRENMHRLQAVGLYRSYALHFLQNAARMKQHGLDRMHFEIGCFPFAPDQEEAWPQMLGGPLTLGLEIPERLKEEGVLWLYYSMSEENSLIATKVGTLLTAVLEQIGNSELRPFQAAIEQGALDAEEHLLEKDAVETFRF